MKKTIAGVAAALLVGGTLAFATALPASATSVDECVPAEAYTEIVPDIVHPAVGEPTITIDNPDYVPAVEASTKWWNFAPNKDQGKLESAPAFPIDERGTWEGPHTEGGPGQDQTGVYQQGNGNGSWFNRENTPGSDAVGEPTIVVDNPDYVAEYTEVVPDIEHPAVTCEQEPTVVEPVVCVASGDWYTEGDDIAPIATPDGLVFNGGSGKAVGIRTLASGNLQGWTSLSFDASNVGDQFFFRLTINASADGGKAYQSLSFPGTSTVTQDSVSYQFGETLAATAERFPNAVITSIGFQTNSGAPADFTSTLASVTGCANVDFTYTEEEPPTEEPPTEEPPVVVPPVVEEPVVTPTPTETPVVAQVASTDKLASTGGDNGLVGLLIAGILALGGTALFAANHVLRTRNRS
jgi:hypothetical protein